MIHAIGLSNKLCKTISIKFQQDFGTYFGLKRRGKEQKKQ